eukprot:403335704
MENIGDISLGKRTDREDDQNLNQVESDNQIAADQQLHITLPKRPRVPLLEGCRSVECFEHLNKIDEGAYGVVYRARDKQTNEIVAIKKLKLDREKEGFPITALRELSTLISLKHPHIVNVKEVVYGSTLDKIYVVMEYMDHELKSILEDRKLNFSYAQIKCLIRQILEGVNHMHKNWIFHRDLKTSNLLYGNNGILKVCDFGLARKFGSPLRPYTNLVVTLWYRAPELLLGTEVYSPAIDMWSVGCIFAELILKDPLMMGKGELDQIDKIFRIFGNPNHENWPGWQKLKFAKNIQLNKKFNKCVLRDKFPIMPTSIDDSMYLDDKGLDLMLKMMTYDPSKRISAEDALNHPWFKESPKTEKIESMPSFQSLNEMSREQLRKKRKKSLDEDQMRQREEMYEKEERYLNMQQKNYQDV